MLFPALNADLTLDPKGRVTLPRTLRNAVGQLGLNRLVAFANGGPKRGLALVKIDDYQAMADTNIASHPMDPRSRLFALAVASTAQTVTIDGNGRLLIPPSLRNLLGFERDLYLFTAGSWIEVWDRARWDQQFSEAASQWDDLFGFGALQTSSSAAPNEHGSVGGDG